MNNNIDLEFIESNQFDLNLDTTNINTDVNEKMNVDVELIDNFVVETEIQDNVNIEAEISGYSQVATQNDTTLEITDSIYPNLEKLLNTKTVSREKGNNDNIFTLINKSVYIVNSNVLSGNIALNIDTNTEGGIFATSFNGDIGTFDFAHSVDMYNNILNLCDVYTVDTGQPFTYNNKNVYGLIQAPLSVKDGDAITNSNLQVSFITIINGVLTMATITGTICLGVPKVTSLRNKPYVLGQNANTGVNSGGGSSDIIADNETVEINNGVISIKGKDGAENGALFMKNDDQFIFKKSIDGGLF